MKRKNKQEEPNYWKTATIILGIIILGFIIIDVYEKIEGNEKETVTIPEVGSVDKEQMKNFLEVFNESGKFLLCNIEDNTCMWIRYK